MNPNSHTVWEEQVMHRFRNALLAATLIVGSAVVFGGAGVASAGHHGHHGGYKHLRAPSHNYNYGYRPSYNYCYPTYRYSAPVNYCAPVAPCYPTYQYVAPCYPTYNCPPSYGW